MSRARLLPVYLEPAPSDAFRRQLDALKLLAEDLVEWQEPVQIASAAGVPTDAVIVPDMSGVAYRSLTEFRSIATPILVVTSEFGTVSMWDWEIRDYLRRRGVETVAPTNLQEFHDIARALAVKTRLREGRMLAYQDDLGAGMQPDIFKRFYWWEDECVQDLQDAFGVTIEHRSYRGLIARADAIEQDRVEAELERISGSVPMGGALGREARLLALRLKLALDDELDETPGVLAAGINCLNESATARTTPCLAWNLLFEERGLMWGCEADLTSMITQFMVWESLRTPAIMTNLYPFLMGDAALKHEKIPYFPPREHPENYILTAHCGFSALMPQSWATRWTLQPPVLEIVDPLANAIDAELPLGDLTIAKITSTMDSFVVTPAQLTNYEQYENSDCLNGAVLRVEDGYRFEEHLASHHAVLCVGDIVRRLDVISGVLGVSMTRI